MINKNDENYVYYLVAKNLKKQRKTKGLTQHKFAEVLNIDIREFFKPINEEFLFVLHATLTMDTISYHIKAKLLATPYK